VFLQIGPYNAMLISSFERLTESLEMFVISSLQQFQHPVNLSPHCILKTINIDRTKRDIATRGMGVIILQLQLQYDNAHARHAPCTQSALVVCGPKFTKLGEPNV